MTVDDEPAAVWLCAQYNVSFVACCVKEAILKGAHLIRLDERCFDVSRQPAISISDRRRALQLASGPTNLVALEKRRSERVTQFLVVPAIKLDDRLVPQDEPFQLLVSNLSSEGIGLVHSERIDADYIVMELAPTSKSPIQVIVRIVRQRELTPPYIEIGGEFLVRLGSIATH